MSELNPEAAVEESSEDGSGRISSVALAFQVLEQVGSVDHPIGVTEIARRMGEQKARIQRHLVTLRSLGALSQDEAGKYRLGWRLVELGQQAITQFDLVELAEREVKGLRDTASLTSALALVSGRGLRMAYVAESAQMVAVTVRNGLAVPLRGSAAGRLLMAFGGSDKYGMDDAAGVDAAHLDKIRLRGFEYSAGEISTGLHSLAAPVLDPNGRMIAALVCVGTHTQIAAPPQDDLIRAVKHFAGEIESKLRQRQK